MDFRNGNCFGLGNVCGDFRYAYSFPKNVTDIWPKYGDATLLKFNSSTNDYVDDVDIDKF